MLYKEEKDGEMETLKEKKGGKMEEDEEEEEES